MAVDVSLGRVGTRLERSARADRVSGEGDVFISAGEGMWAPRLRLLFLTDGRITSGHGPMEFGLGPPIDTLQDRLAVPWLDLSVDVVDRDPLHTSSVTVEGFRLTRVGFDLD